MNDQSFNLRLPGIYKANNSLRLFVGKCVIADDLIVKEQIQDSHYSVMVCLDQSRLIAIGTAYTDNDGAMDMLFLAVFDCVISVHDAET